MSVPVICWQVGVKSVSLWGRSGAQALFAGIRNKRRRHNRRYHGDKLSVSSSGSRVSGNPFHLSDIFSPVQFSYRWVSLVECCNDGCHSTLELVCAERLEIESRESFRFDWPNDLQIVFSKKTSDQDQEARHTRPLMMRPISPSESPIAFLSKAELLI